MKKKLMLNTIGAWRHVITFEAADEEAVRMCATLLGVIQSGGGSKSSATTFCIVDEKGTTTAHWRPGRGWVERGVPS